MAKKSTGTEPEAVVKKPRKPRTQHVLEAPQWDLGRYIQAFIDEKGWSRRKFAAYAKISHPYMNVIIRGIDTNTGLPPTPSVEIMNKLAKALNTSVEDLVLRFQGIDPAKAPKRKNGSKYELLVLAMAQRLAELYPDPVEREAKLHDLLQSDAFSALLEPDSTAAFQ